MEINPAKHKQGLTSKSISELKWNYLGHLISLSLTFAIGFILARLLRPGPFGLAAIALTTINPDNLFAASGSDSMNINAYN